MTQLENKTITSNTKLPAESLDQHFKVTAGPGAGKTHWLVNHIKNVLENSNRLNPTSRIACITYTVVAAEEIRKRLDISDDTVEVSTIHSFLYKNIVKPYAFLLKDDDGKPLIEVKELDGHDEHKPSIGNIKKWIENFGELNQKYLIYEKSTIDYLARLFWKLDSLEECVLEARNFGGPLKSLLSKAVFYKKLYWKEGIIHHEDVLYFSYKILMNNSSLIEFIASRYPYIFLDEFQDTNPIQTKIIKLLSEKGTFVGVIGDPAQSIFQFQGAKRDDFINFSLPGQCNFEIKGNRRSSKKIIALLNHLRTGDPVQQEQEGKCLAGENVCILISEDKAVVVDFFCMQTQIGNRCILARKKEWVAELKSKRNNASGDPWDELRKTNFGNRDKFIYSLLIASEYALKRRYEIAIKEIIKTIRTDKDGALKSPFKSKRFISKLEKRSLAVSLLGYLVNDRENYVRNNLFDFYKELSSIISVLVQRELEISTTCFCNFAAVSVLSV